MSIILSLKDILESRNKRIELPCDDCLIKQALDKAHFVYWFEDEKWKCYTFNFDNVEECKYLDFVVDGIQLDDEYIAELKECKHYIPSIQWKGVSKEEMFIINILKDFITLSLYISPKIGEVIEAYNTIRQQFPKIKLRYSIDTRSFVDILQLEKRNFRFFSLVRDFYETNLSS